MSKKVKITTQLCKSCKWKTTICGGIGGCDTCCGYLLKTEHSRTLDDNGHRRISKGTCDKYEAGDSTNIKKWTSDDMTLNTKKALQRRKEHDEQESEG